MELQFQPQRHHHQVPVSKPSSLKSKGRRKGSSSSSNNRFVGVRQRQSGRWVAEIKDTTQKIRVWLGTFETAEEAARAYDEAACLLRGTNTRTNFITSAAPDSPLASRIRNLLNLKKQNKTSCSTALRTTNPPPTAEDSSTSSPSQPSSTSYAGASSATSTTSVEPAKSCHESSKQDGRQIMADADQVYRPCFSGSTSGGEELELIWPSSPLPSTDNSWLFDCLELPKVGGGGGGSSESMSEFERMEAELERQFSVPMNGVGEYWDVVQGSSDAPWDLPSLCHLSCRT